MSNLKKIIVAILSLTVVALICMGIWILFNNKQTDTPETESTAEIETMEESSGEITENTEDDIRDNTQNDTRTNPSKKETVKFDDYYGETYYTDQTDMEKPTIKIEEEELAKINSGLLLNELALSEEMENRVRSRLTSFASSRDMDATSIKVKNTIYANAENVGRMRTEYGIIYNDKDETKAILVIYPENATYGMFMDVFPADGTEEHFQKLEWTDTENSPDRMDAFE